MRQRFNALKFDAGRLRQHYST